MCNGISFTKTLLLSILLWGGTDLLKHPRSNQST